MKKVILSSLVCISLFAQAQVQTPKASPVAKVEQRAGLTDISISYSRPAVNGRKIFGELIPFGVRWRLGANENTKITTSDVLIFGADTSLHRIQIVG
jgi:methyl coenzyme M reductase subunit D